MEGAAMADEPEPEKTETPEVDDLAWDGAESRRFIRTASEFCQNFLPPPVCKTGMGKAVEGTEDLITPAVRQARDLALIAAFRLIAAEFDRQSPDAIAGRDVPFVLDVSRIGRG